MIQEIAHEIIQKFTDGAAVWVLPILGAVLWACLKLLWTKLQQFKDFWTSCKRALAAVARRETPGGLQ